MRTLQRNLILSIAAAFLLTIAVPALSLAQGHGNGHGRGHNVNWSNDNDRFNRNWQRHYNKKCGKFVNCHDARNGRVDGRGPRGTLVGNYIWRDGRRVRAYNNNYRTIRNRRYYRRVIDNR